MILIGAERKEMIKQSDNSELSDELYKFLTIKNTIESEFPAELQLDSHSQRDGHLQESQHLHSLGYNFNSFISQAENRLHPEPVELDRINQSGKEEYKESELTYEELKEDSQEERLKEQIIQAQNGIEDLEKKRWQVMKENEENEENEENIEKIKKQLSEAQRRIAKLQEEKEKKRLKNQLIKKMYDYIQGSRYIRVSNYKPNDNNRQYFGPNVRLSFIENIFFDSEKNKDVVCIEYRDWNKGIKIEKFASKKEAELFCDYLDDNKINPSQYACQYSSNFVIYDEIEPPLQDRKKERSGCHDKNEILKYKGV